jgi:hypothetical protein
VILTPMAQTAYEPLGSMGTDTPLAVLSDQSQNISIISNNYLLKLQIHQSILFVKD